MTDQIGSFHPGRVRHAKHVGLIPDGARRWAQREGWPLEQAYLHSMELLTTVISWLFDSQVTTASVYLSSLQNFRRTAQEVSAMCNAETAFCRDMLPAVVARHKLQVLPVGELHVLPSTFEAELRRLQACGSPQETRTLYLCVAYCPVQEIIRAVKKVQGPELFVQHLDMPQPIDLILRTGGANLLSNFLPLQAGFARLCIIDKLFNDLKIADLDDALTAFAQLKRLYGE